jgi:hypothetical protein
MDWRRGYQVIKFSGYQVGQSLAPPPIHALEVEQLDNLITGQASWADS